VVAHVGDCPATSNPLSALVALAVMASIDTVNPETGLLLTEVMPNNPPAALRDIASRPWYTRSWVTQEMVLARSLLCLYGNATNAAPSAMRVSSRSLTDSRSGRTTTCGTPSSSTSSPTTANWPASDKWASGVD